MLRSGVEKSKIGSENFSVDLTMWLSCQNVFFVCVWDVNDKICFKGSKGNGKKRTAYSAWRQNFIQKEQKEKNVSSRAMWSQRLGLQLSFSSQGRYVRVKVADLVGRENSMNGKR